MPLSLRTASAARGTARIVQRVPLLYAGGADPSLDRPAHVRAASALAWVAAHTLAVVQDDALFLAIVDTRTFATRAVPLPAGPGGARLFGDDRGTKHLKLDLEACIATPDADGVTTLYAFGSGSTVRRESVVVARDPAGPLPEPRVVPIPAFYSRLRAHAGFAGSELNVEGALLDGAVLRLFNRGNGAPQSGLIGVDATCDLPWADFLAHLAHPTQAPPPRPRTIVQYDLGTIGGVRLTFTDAAPHDGGMIFSAAAEASPDAVGDGPVAGSRLGMIRGDSVRSMPIVDSSGEPATDKIEGIAVDPTDPTRVFIVADHDDPDRPSDLLIVLLEP